MTATNNTDYLGFVDQVVTFPDGSAQHTVNIPIINRTGVQGDRTFRFFIDTPTGGVTIGNPNSVIVTISDFIAVGTGTADLSWIPPTTNEDGSPLTLTGFNIYSGPSATNLQQIDSVGAGQTTYTASSLASGTHYFAVTAVSDTSAESVFSDIASKTIP